jgi:hypothetical protein
MKRSIENKMKLNAQQRIQRLKTLKQLAVWRDMAKASGDSVAAWRQKRKSGHRG